MKITLTLNLSSSLAEALAGMRTVDDAGEELYAALEAAASVYAISRGVTDDAVVDAFRVQGSVKGAARVTGLARSTVRARLLRAGVSLPDGAEDARVAAYHARVRALPGR